MSDAPDNPAAFPGTDWDGNEQSGMSLRDWFAGQALVGMLAHREAVAADFGIDEPRPTTLREKLVAAGLMP